MSDDAGMADTEGSPRPTLDEGSRTAPVAVGFVPPPREFRGGSISSASEATISVGSCTQGEDLPFPDFLPITFGFLRQDSRLRFFCLTCIQSPWFERICMLVILLNCITLGMYQPCFDYDCTTYRCKILSKFDDAIFAYFTIEMTIKMIAMGVTGKGSYMAESWNRLDFFIVLAGVVEYCLVMESNMNLSAIRTIRVLRPLRAINRIPSMRILVMLLLDTLPMLGNVLLLCFFVFFIFGIVGVQLWKGILRQRCFLADNMTHYGDPITNYYNVTEQEKDYICSLTKDNGMHRCESLPPMKHKDTKDICTESVTSMHMGYNESSCINWNQYYTECRHGKINPFQGTISFDNIGYAWVSIFLVISLEGWTDIMYYIQDAHSFWDWIYFVLLIVIGSFFMINLCLVVIATQFSETKKREIERMRQERARFQSTSTLASGSLEQASCYSEILKIVAQFYRRGRRILRVKYLKYKRRWKGERERPSKKISLKRKRRKKIYEYQADNNGSGGTIIVPSGNFNSGPLTVYNNVVGPTTIITPPEILEPRSLPINIYLNSHDGFDPENGNPRRPAMLSLPSGTAADTHSYNEHMSLSPISAGASSPRRRSSVMFSDMVLMHENISDLATRNNVCISEKTTQTEPEEPLDPSLFLTVSRPMRPPLAKVLALPENKGTLTCGELLALSGALSVALPAHLGVDAQSVQTLYSSLAKGVKHFSAPSLFYTEDGPFPPNSTPSDSYTSDSEWSSDDWSDDDERKKKVAKNCVSRFLDKIQGWLKKLVEHKYFQRSILVAILINTLSMGIEYHNQPQYLTHMVEVSNVIFSGVFALEMLLKVLADGPFGYISNGFNVFDGVIVILSVIEMYESYFPGDSTTASTSQGSNLSVLRTFRLLRILKLVRFMPQLRRQLFVMLRTMDNVAIFFSLLILFIFIFSVLGMLLFGGKFCMKPNGGEQCSCDEIFAPESDCICDRKHFDNLLWATVTVFQILTQEDWNIVLFNGMEKTNHWASLYFVALMTFGNYVLFNLLVAILVEGFSAEGGKRRERLEKEQKKKEKLREIQRMKKLGLVPQASESSKIEARKPSDSDDEHPSEHQSMTDCRSIFSSEEGFSCALNNSSKDSPTKVSTYMCKVE